MPGNRLKDDKNIYEINNLNQITNISNSGSENRSYLYDNNGNLIQDNDKKYFYDYKNRLVKVENLATKEVIGEYFYDTLSRRYKKVTKTDTINYIYSNENILSEKYLDNTQKYYINGIGIDNLVGFLLGKPDFSELEASEYEFCTTKVLFYKDDFIKFGHQNIIDRCLVLQEKSKNLIFKKYYFEKDNLGSIIGISNDNGELISSYEYDSFGNILNNSNPNIKNSRFFTSREFDEEIGFYYYRARYYDARTGKFISRDPIDIADDVNLYVYVGNNPLNFVDPSGMAKAVLTIYSWREKGGIIDGHSRIEIFENGSTTSYGLRPDIFNSNNEKILNNGVQINLELELKKEKYNSNFQEISIILNQEKLDKVNTYISDSISNKKWTVLSPCSDFAADIWNLASNKKLDHRNLVGISNPNTLADSIEKLKKIFLKTITIY